MGAAKDRVIEDCSLRLEVGEWKWDVNHIEIKVPEKFWRGRIIPPPLSYNYLQQTLLVLYQQKVLKISNSSKTERKYL